METHDQLMRDASLDYMRHYTTREAPRLEALRAAYTGMTHEEQGAIGEGLQHTMIEEMQSDGDFDPHFFIYEYLHIYTDAQRYAVDFALISLCGWTLPTLLGKSGLAFDDPEADDE